MNNFDFYQKGWLGAVIFAILFACFLSYYDTALPSWLAYLTGAAGGWMGRSFNGAGDWQWKR